MKSAIIVLIVLCVPVVAFSATLNVPATFPTIQGAINAAVNGDTVLVASGTYVENIDFLGKAITVQSEEGPSVTVIDGNQADSVVSFMSGEGLDSVLEGFTITNGSGKIVGSGDTHGGGIFCKSASPTIQNNIISKNKAVRAGGILTSEGASPLIHSNMILENEAKGHDNSSAGGIACYGTSPTITSNIISKNKAIGNGSTAWGSTGGGIFCNYSLSAKIYNNTITENEAEYGGGINIQFNNSTISIANNIISANTATGGAYAGGASFGGGILVAWNSSAMIVNNMIYENIADYGGSGIGISKSASADIVNNTIYGNTADPDVKGGGGGIGLYESGNATVVNTILWNDDAPNGPEISVELGSILDIIYSDVEGGQLTCYVDGTSTLNWDSGNIDSDPLFVDPANGDYHLTFLSPCRGSGDNSAVTELTDFEGDPRICHGTVDMGADECFRHLYCTGNVTPGGSVELKFIDLPGASPVGLWIAFNALDTPIPGAYGDWWLIPPMVGPFSLPPIPSNGVYVLPGTIPASPPGSYTLYLQAIMGTPLKLTNLCTMDVQ